MKIETRIQTICLFILAAIASMAALYYLRSVLVPFVLAVFISFCFSPIINFQIHYIKIRRSLAVTVTVFISCLILFYSIAFLSSSIQWLVDNAGQYQQQIENATVWVEKKLSKAHLTVPFGETQTAEQKVTEPQSVEPQSVEPQSVELQTEEVQTEEVQTDKPQFSELQALDLSLNSYIRQIFDSIMSILSNGVMVVIFVMFMILGKHSYSTKDIPLLKEMENQITKYLLTLFFISATTGITVGMTLYLLGVKYSFFFAFLTFVLNFIPTIGSIIATLLPLPVAFFSADLSITIKVLVVAIPAVIQFVLGSVLQPKLLGQSLDLHPVVVMLSLMFWGVIWGVVGMFIATPITAIMKIIMEKIEFTKPIADVMSGNLDTIGSLFTSED